MPTRHGQSNTPERSNDLRYRHHPFRFTCNVDHRHWALFPQLPQHVTRQSDAQPTRIRPVCTGARAKTGYAPCAYRLRSEPCSSRTRTPDPSKSWDAHRGAGMAKTQRECRALRRSHERRAVRCAGYRSPWRHALPLDRDGFRRASGGRGAHRGAYRGSVAR